MKRFLVFAFENFYPNGGWNDVLREGNDPDGSPVGSPVSFDTLEDATEAAIGGRRTSMTLTHVVDLEQGKVVVDEETFEETLSKKN